MGKHTNDHDVEVETLADALSVPLVGKVGESNVTSQFATNDILVIRCTRGHTRRRGYWHQVRSRYLGRRYIEARLFAECR